MKSSITIESEMTPAQPSLAREDIGRALEKLYKTL